MINISIGIMAYNEERNITLVLESLIKQGNKDIKEIIVVSSGSTDLTDTIVANYKNKKVTLIVQNKREGKASAINRFLDEATGDILVLVSADVVVEKNAIRELCTPLQDDSVGIVSSRPIPSSTEQTILYKAIKLQWSLHHMLSLINPKCGEMIAFRNVISRIENTAADEEYISMLIQQLGYTKVYAPRAIVRIRTPRTITDFVLQKRRVYWGHLELKELYGYITPSLEFRNLGKIIFKKMNMQSFLPILWLIGLESFSRMLGTIDWLSKKKHYIWKIAKTTKH